MRVEGGKILRGKVDWWRGGVRLLTGALGRGGGSLLGLADVDLDKDLGFGI